MSLIFGKFLISGKLELVFQFVIDFISVSEIDWKKMPDEV